MFSHRYLYTIVKKYDGTLGSSTLWTSRLLKAYGALSNTENETFSKEDKFDYSYEQICVARKLRTGFYERLLRPEEIFNALHYCPISMDVEIFDSIYNDLDGIVTIPDEDNKKEEFSHCFTVYGFNERKTDFIVDSNWPNWGNKGEGLISLEYLQKYFITAFANDFAIKLIYPKSRRELKRGKIKLNNKRWSYSVFQEGTFRDNDKRIKINIEIFDAGGNISGWIHFAIDKQANIVEILDIFIIKEYRNNGLGTFFIKFIINDFKFYKIFGYVAGQDLIGEREELLKNFFIKNNFKIYVDRTNFFDCKFRVELNK